MRQVLISSICEHVGRSYSRSYNFPQVNPLDREAFMSTRVELCLL